MSMNRLAERRVSGLFLLVRRTLFGLLHPYRPERRNMRGARQA